MDVSGEVALPKPHGTPAATTTTTTTSTTRRLVDFFAVLPPELALYVVSFLGHHELCMLARVCHLCRGLSYDDENWRQLYIRTWALRSTSRAEVQLPLCGSCTSWRTLFRDRKMLEWEYCSIDVNAKDEEEEQGGGQAAAGSDGDGDGDGDDPNDDTDTAMDTDTTGTEAEKAHTKTPPPPRSPIQVLGRGKYKDKKLIIPATARKWLSWGHILQKKVDELRNQRMEEKKAGAERTVEYLKQKGRFHETVTRLLVIACEEYASAASVASTSPKDDTTLSTLYVSTNNWGISLTELARMKHGPVADMLFLRAYAKLAQTAELRRGCGDLWWVLSEWAVTLRAHAARKMAEGSSLLVATAQGTDYASVDNLFEQSCKKLAEAHALYPTDSQILSEWGDGLSEHATSKIAATAKSRKVLSPAQLEQAQSLFRESYGKYEDSLSLSQMDLDRDIVLSNYGLALSDHAMVAEPAESKDLFARSYEKYRLAASLKPDNVLTQCNLAMTYVLHSCTLADAAEREQLWASAEEILNTQVLKNDYWTYFCMARLASVRGHEAACQAWLEKCAKKNYLAKRTKWFCVHFANVKRAPWFRAMKQAQTGERTREREVLANLFAQQEEEAQA